MTQVQAGADAPNSLRGEAQIAIHGHIRVLRPSFTALIAAEEEVGPLFGLVERAGAGELRLAEMTALFWHCLQDRTDVTRADMGDAIAAQGLAGCADALRALLGAILKGSG